MAFYVVQFLELPYEGIDDYVCVPHTWVIVRKRQDGRSVIAYPEDRDPSVIRERAKKKERCGNEWKFYVAAIQHQSNSYQNAEYWITSRRNRRPLVKRIADSLEEKETRRMSDTPPESDTNPQNSTQEYSSKLNDNLAKQLPRMLIKRPVLFKPNKQLDGKRSKLNETVESSSASVADANAESKREQPTRIQDNQAFNSTQNSAGSGSPKVHLEPEVHQSPEERHTEVTANTRSSIQNQQSNNDATKPQKKKYNSWRFVLPPEYDPHDTKWTLKYRTNLPGLVELTPGSGVYVSYGDLIYCQHVSKDCESLARRLLLAVFNRKALSACLTITEKANAFNNVKSNIRPELDNHACSVLLRFVVEHGRQRGWNIHLQPILRTLHSKIHEIRFKYGEMVEC